MKNHYSLNPGEVFAAQELMRKRKDLRFAFPLKDDGWDLLAIKVDGSKLVRLQIKESRVFRRGNSWHQVRESKLGDADVFIFVSYVVTEDGDRLGFRPEFVIVPTTELKRRCEAKKASKGKYSFYFLKRDRKVVDVREGKGKEIDFTEFDSAWDKI